MTDSNSIANAIQIAKDNPIDGTIEQVCNTSISIAESSKTMDKSVFNLYKEKIDIEPKIISIGVPNLILIITKINKLKTKTNSKIGFGDNL